MLPIRLLWQLPSVYRAAWQIIVIHTLGLTLVLGITTLTLFSKQQTIYQAVLPVWKNTEKYQSFLDSNTLNYRLFDPPNFDQTLITNLKQLQADYESFNQAIQLDLQHLSFNNQNSIDIDFWTRTQALWQKQLALATHRHTVIQFQLCLAENYLELVNSQNSWLETLQAAGSQNQLSTIKDQLNQAKSKLDDIQANLHKLDQCLEIPKNLPVIQVEFSTNNLRDNYQQYQIALTELVAALDNLDLQKIQQADQLFNSAKINADTVQAFDNMLKNIIQILNKQDEHLARLVKTTFLKQKTNFDTISQWTLIK
jgi:hypothetical protein